MKQYLTN